MTDLASNAPPGLPPDIGRRVRSWSVSVSNRTGSRPFYNAIRKSVHFCLGDPTIGVAYFEVFKHGMYALPCEDAACRAIYSGRLPKEVKNRRLGLSHKAAQDAERAKVDADIDARRSDIRASAARIFRGRKVFSLSD